MLEQYSLIQKGDVVELTHNEITVSFIVLKVQDTMVALTWTYENVVQLKWVPKTDLLAQIYARRA